MYLGYVYNDKKNVNTTGANPERVGWGLSRLKGSGYSSCIEKMA